MIVIIDYNAGNLTSVQRALCALGIDSEITSDPDRVLQAERIIFPGVGACGKAMANLKERGLDIAIKKAFGNGIPIFGICLGTQIIMEHSEENDCECLGLIKGRVIKFPDNLTDPYGKKLKIPHMGWNRVILKRHHPLFTGIDTNSEFYFVHGYYPCPDDTKQTIGETDYGIRFVSVLGKSNLFAVQFHPEKSGRPGLRILKNFSQWKGQTE